jgi:hypothetical protein
MGAHRGRHSRHGRHGIPFSSLDTHKIGLYPKVQPEIGVGNVANSDSGGIVPAGSDALKIGVCEITNSDITENIEVPKSEFQNSVTPICPPLLGNVAERLMQIKLPHNFLLQLVIAFPNGLW